MRAKKVVEIKKFNNFNYSNEIKAYNYYNFLPTTNLKNTHGISIATLPKSSDDLSEQQLNISNLGVERIDGVAYFKQYARLSEKTVHRLLVYASDKKIYINQMLYGSFDLHWLYSLTANSAPIVLMYKKDDIDVMIMATVDEMVMWRTGYSPYKIENVPIITSMCMNEGVLFCTVKDPAYKIWYATNLDAENVGNISKYSDYIPLDDDLGDARKVVVFNEEVYVFRDYGISKINYLKEEKSVSLIYKSNTKIYPNTIDVSGNSILFMTKEGLYSFNGVKVTKTQVDFVTSLNVNNDGAVASSMGEKYFLALRLDFEDGKKILCENEEYVNNVLLIVDTHDNTYEIIRGVDIKTLTPVKTNVFEKMLVTFNSAHADIIGQVVETSKCVDESLPKYWSSESVVSNYNTKLFTKLKIYADKGVVVKLLNEGNQLSFTTYNSGLNEFSFRLCCKDVRLEISSEEENVMVKHVALEYYEY